MCTEKNDVAGSKKCLDRVINIDTSCINIYRGYKIGRAFYKAYMKFISDPENEKMIAEGAERLKAQQSEKSQNDFNKIKT